MSEEPGGKKFDTDKVRMELLPVEALVGTAKVLTFGAKKYDDRNWEKGIKYSRVYGALMRHMTAWWNGEDTDEETGLSHLHHAGCCMMFLQTFVEREQEGLDDRPNCDDNLFVSRPAAPHPDDFHSPVRVET